MTRSLLRQYTRLVGFLSKALGPDYEIALHDLTDKSNSIVAIANGHISGRSLGAPLTSTALSLLAEKAYEQEDFRINYNGISVGNKMLRSSMMFIKDDADKPVGLLSVNFDDSRFQELSTRLFQLCHPDEFVDKNIFYSIEHEQVEEKAGDEAESFHNSIDAVADEVLAQIMGAEAVPPERMVQEEKMRVVYALDKKGVFLLKGAVGHIADKLCCSQASIYRYLSRIHQENRKESGI